MLISLAAEGLWLVAAPFDPGIDRGVACGDADELLLFGP